MNIHELRSAFYESLTEGQQALIMYDHAIKSEFEFCRMSENYHMSRTLIVVRKGAEHFEDIQMFQLFSDLEDIISTHNKRKVENDSEYATNITKLFDIFQEIAPKTISQIGKCIKPTLLILSNLSKC